MAEAVSDKFPRHNMIKRVLQLLLQVAILGYIIHYIIAHKSELVRLLDLDGVDIVMVFTLIILGSIIRSWELKYMLGNLGARISFPSSACVTIGATLLNYLPMNAGTVIKARILKKHSSLKYAHFVSVMSAIILITFLAGGSLGLIAVIVSGQIINKVNTILIIFFLSCIIGGIVVLHIPAKLVGQRNSWFKIALSDMLTGWQEIRQQRHDLFTLFVVAVLKLLVASLRLWICFGAVGTQVNLLGCVMFASVSNLLMLVNITPGSLGVRELLIAAIAQFSGFSFEAGLFAAGLDRVFSLVFSICGGLPSLAALKIKKMI